MQKQKYDSDARRVQEMKTVKEIAVHIELIVFKAICEAFMNWFHLFPAVPEPAAPAPETLPAVTLEVNGPLPSAVEMDLIYYLQEGLSYQQIATKKNKTLRAIKERFRRMRKKLGIRSKTKGGDCKAETLEYAAQRNWKRPLPL